MRRNEILVVGVTVTGMLVAACSGSSAQQTAANIAAAERVTVTTGTVENRIVATGKVVASASAAVAFERNGVVAEVMVKEGQQVKAGQALARLDTTDLQLTAQQQWASYLSAQATYSQSVKGPTAAEIKAAQASIASAQSSIASAQASKNDLYTGPSEGDLVQVQAYIAWQQAEANIKKATLVAPFAGIITAVNYDLGDYAGAGQAAVQVSNFAVPIFELDVDEADLGQVKVGQTAQVRLQTYPAQPINAKVESISTVGTNTGAVVNYKVKLSMGKATGEGEQPVVLINMSGTSEIVTAKKENALVVPNTAVTIDAQTKRYSVDLLKSDNTTQKIEVELGFRDGTQTQIIGDVKAGDTLIIPSRTVQTANPAAGR